MFLTGMSGANSTAQFITVLVIFVLVLLLAFWTTRFMARYQKAAGRRGSNIEVVETCAVGNGKYIQIVRLADTYVAIAVCKDTVTLLAELEKERLVFDDAAAGTGLNFKELFRKAKSVYPDSEDRTEDETKNDL